MTENHEDFGLDLFNFTISLIFYNFENYIKGIKNYLSFLKLYLLNNNNPVRDNRSRLVDS